MRSSSEPSTQEVLAGLVERVTFHNAENGCCVLRAKARGHRDLVTVVGHAAIVSAGEWISASGEMDQRSRPRSAVQGAVSEDLSADRRLGRIFVLRADLIAAETRSLLVSAARIVLVAQHGSLSDQLDRVANPIEPIGPLKDTPMARPGRLAARPTPELEFFNGLGGRVQSCETLIESLAGGVADRIIGPRGKLVFAAVGRPSVAAWVKLSDSPGLSAGTKTVVRPTPEGYCGTAVR